jgi:hypothetical protein
MGKRRKRMTMERYAKKYATKRAALGFDTRKVENKLIEIDLESGQEIKEEEAVVVVSNSKPAEQKEDTPPWEPELQLEEVKVEEPKEEVPPPAVEVKKPARKRTTRRKTTAKKTEE